MAEMTDPPAIKKPVVARKNKLFKGYAAFNDGNRKVLADLFCDTFTDAEGNEFPAWHKMSNAGTVTGKDDVLDYLLDELRTQGGAEAELLGVSSDGNVSITVDFTYNGPEGDHACADKILFDDSGRIKEVWHCKADSHDD
jgi:hypothetical protein